MRKLLKTNSYANVVALTDICKTTLEAEGGGGETIA